MNPHRQVNVQRELNAALELEEVAQQETLVLAEEKKRLESELDDKKRELGDKLRINIDDQTPRETETFCQELRRQIKLATVKQKSPLNNIVDYNKIKKNPGKIAAILAMGIIGTVVQVYSLPDTSTETKILALEKYGALNRQKDAVVRAYRENVTNELKKRINSDCDKRITLSEFIKSYQTVASEDLVKTWKIESKELDEVVSFGVWEYNEKEISFHKKITCDSRFVPFPNCYSHHIVISIPTARKLTDALPKKYCPVNGKIVIL